MLKSMLIAAALSVASFAAVGCQSDDSSGSSARKTGMVSPDVSVVCDKCGTVSKVPVLNDKGHPIPGKYVERSKDICPECARAADKGMAAGSTMTCDSCGGHLKATAAK